MIGRTIGEIEALPKESRAYGVRSGNRLLVALPDLVIGKDDVVAVAARYEAHAARGDVIGPEVSDLALLDIPVDGLNIVVATRLLAENRWLSPRNPSHAVFS